jgi:hypothetical protein
MKGWKERLKRLKESFVVPFLFFVLPWTIISCSIAAKKKIGSNSPYSQQTFS